MSEDSADGVQLIAVMGVTGSGKSNFIRLVTGLTGNDAPVVGDSLESCTKETKSYECSINGRHFIFLDTPGFDDTYRGDANILANIAETLSSSYRSHLKLSGIIYLHRIKDEKVGNALMRNFSMFKHLCGSDAYKNVILATTFWDELQNLDVTKGEDRERQLLAKPEWWGHMSSQGCKIRRFMNTRESAREILGELTGLPVVTLQIQDEMVNRGLAVQNTSAGEALGRELQELKKEFQLQIKQAQEDREEAERKHNDELARVFREKEDEMRKMLNDMNKEQEDLRADHRRERMIMEQKFDDQFYRMEKNRVKKEEEVSALLKRMDAEADQRLQKTLEDSRRAVQELASKMTAAQAEDRRKHEETLRKVQEQQAKGDEQAREWKKEADRLRAELQDAISAKNNAVDPAESERLRQRISELERERDSNSSRFWNILSPIADLIDMVSKVLEIFS